MYRTGFVNKSSAPQHPIITFKCWNRPQTLSPISQTWDFFPFLTRTKSPTNLLWQWQIKNASAFPSQNWHNVGQLSVWPASLVAILADEKQKDMTGNGHKILSSLDVPPQDHSTDTTAQPFITQKCFTDLLEICHHLGVLYIFLKSLKIYGGDLNFLRTICSTLWNTKESGKTTLLRYLEQWLRRGQKPENALRSDMKQRRRRVAGLEGSPWDVAGPAQPVSSLVRQAPST